MNSGEIREAHAILKRFRNQLDRHNCHHDGLRLHANMALASVEDIWAELARLEINDRLDSVIG